MNRRYIIDDPSFPKHQKRRNMYFNIYKSLADRPNLAIAYSRMMAKVARFMYTYTVSQDNWIAFERSIRNVILEQHAYIRPQKT